MLGFRSSMGLGFGSHQNHCTTTLELEMYLRCFGEVQRRVMVVVCCGKVGTVVDQKLYGGLRPSHEQGLDIPLVLPIVRRKLWISAFSQSCKVSHVRVWVRCVTRSRFDRLTWCGFWSGLIIDTTNSCFIIAIPSPFTASMRGVTSVHTINGSFLKKPGNCCK